MTFTPAVPSSSVNVPVAPTKIPYPDELVPSIVPPDTVTLPDSPSIPVVPFIVPPFTLIGTTLLELLYIPELLFDVNVPPLTVTELVV